MLGLLLSLAVRTPEPFDLNGVLCHPSQLMVKLEPGRAAKATALSGYRIVRRMPQIDWAVVSIPTGTHRQAMAALRRASGVRLVEVDRAARLAYDPNDAMWPDMWHMRAVRADVAWDQSFGGPGAIIAIMDTGVKWDHPDLADNIWTNEDEIDGNGLDDDGNGYIDDIHGYDFGYGDPLPNDVHGHGTACAGLAAAVQDNSIGVTGVAPRARIMCLKASIDSGYFYDSANVPAYLYAAANGAKVVSCSFFSDRVSQSERDAVDYLAAHGVLPVVAAGNDNSILPFYPAAYENSLSVGALGTNLLKAGFSNFGSWVDVAAPGTNLRSTSIGSSGYTEGFGGTSGACPHVAGLAGLLFGTDPLATVSQVRNAIEDTGTPTIQNPFGEWTNYGLIRADAALLALASPAPPKAPRLSYMTPIGVSLNDPPPPVGYHRTRIYGRGFQPPRVVEVRFGANVATLLEQTRDWVDVVLPAGGGTVQVWVDGVLVGEIVRSTIKALTYPVVEASTEGASLSGGFDAMLRADGQVVTVTRRSNGEILFEGALRKVLPFTGGQLNLRRRYPGATEGTERILLYNWSTDSYPYGSFTQLYSGPISSDWRNFRLKLSRPPNHIDPEGTMYLVIEVQGTNSGTTLEVDQVNVERR